MNNTYAPIPVRLAFSAIWTLPFVIFFALSFFLAPRKGDPARVAVVWLKVLLPLAALSTILIIISSAAQLKILGQRYIDLDQNSLEVLWKLAFYASAIGSLFNEIAQILVLVTFVELGNGFMYALTHQRTVYQKTFRYLALFLATALVVMKIAYFVRYIIMDKDFGDGLISYSELALELQALSKLYLASVVLLWICALTAVAYGAVAVHFWKRQAFVRGIAIEFLFATILIVIQTTYSLAYEATYVVGKPLEDWGAPPVMSYLLMIFNSLPLGIAISLIFAIAIRKEKGLWSKRGSFHGGIEAGKQQGHKQPAGCQ